MIDKIASAVPVTGTPGPMSAGFEKALHSTKSPKSFGAAGPSKPSTPATPRTSQNAVEPGSRLEVAPPPAARPGGVKILNEVQRAQARLDQLLKMAESGRTFSPAELLAFQAHACRASQELDLAGKVVEKGTAAVKQTLQTQI
jgi:hypothetical protein